MNSKVGKILFMNINMLCNKKVKVRKFGLMQINNTNVMDE